MCDFNLGFPRSTLCSHNCGMKLFRLPLWVSEPISTPYPMQSPTAPLQYFLAQTITVTRRPSAVVRSTIALHSQNVFAWLRRIDNPQVNSKTRYANLRMGMESSFTNYTRDGLLE